MEQSSLAFWWYGDDEASFLSATGRNLITFTLGGVFGAATLNLVKRGLSNISDPTGEKRVEKAKTEAVVLQSKLGSDVSSTSQPALSREAL